MIPEATAGEDVQAFVGGSTASNVDLAEEIQSRLLLVIGAGPQLRRADGGLPVAAGAAAGGGDQRVVRRGRLRRPDRRLPVGWAIDALGIDTNSDSVPIASYVPLMMFAVLFGLSMDYQVFLLGPSRCGDRRATGTRVDRRGYDERLRGR